MGSAINQYAVAVGTADTRVMGPNPTRTALVISSPQLYRLSVSIGGPAVAGQGIVIQPGQPPFVMHQRDYGDSLSNGIQAICDPTGETIAFTEIFSV